MPLNRAFVINALLKHNFLPAQKSDKDELPPIFNSTEFSEALATSLASPNPRRRIPYAGYDAVQYRMTRFNGVTRICSIPHPRAYANLAVSIADNWSYFNYVLTNPVSKVVPREHADGRVIVMDYGSAVPRTLQALESSFGQRYLVSTDISNCFPSIYSHAISWATVGVSEAKQHAGDRTKWYNKLDAAVMGTKRNETTGIPIGPATSNILAEAILARVDEALREKYVYTRYIDDYSVSCEDHRTAESFVLALSDELAKFNLALNIGKTTIAPMPQSSRQDWVVDLRRALPKKDNVSIHDAMDFLDFTLRLADRTPDGSVLKFGLKALIGNVLDGSRPADYEVVRLVLRYAINFSFHHAILIPLLERLFDAVLLAGGIVPVDQINQLLIEHIRFRRSDAISWLLYYAMKYGVSVTDECAQGVMEAEDCIPLLMLYKAGKLRHRRRVIAFAKSLDPRDLYKLDQYWLLLYELFREGKIANPYATGSCPDGAFEAMAAAKLGFINAVPATP